jgi:acyl-CoA synthetase (AMP-forming)/AMP-acid ligase II
MAIIDFFDRGWSINPHGAAYIQDDRVFSFQEVGELTCRIANALLATGLPKETKGAVWALNDTIAWACALGLWRANMCWLPVGARNSAQENHFVLEQFDCEVLFYQKYFAAVVAELQPRLPSISHWICIDGETPEVARSVTLAEWTKNQRATKPHVPPVAPPGCPRG